jgi:hypothetical protein
MARSDAVQGGIERVAARFPDDAARLKSLCIAEPSFRELCEEYGLAQASLALFEAMPDAADRPEVPDYRAVIAELETEIGRYLGEVRPGR